RTTAARPGRTLRPHDGTLTGTAPTPPEIGWYPNLVKFLSPKRKRGRPPSSLAYASGSEIRTPPEIERRAFLLDGGQLSRSLMDRAGRRKGVSLAKSKKCGY